MSKDDDFCCACIFFTCIVGSLIVLMSFLIFNQQKLTEQASLCVQIIDKVDFNKVKVMTREGFIHTLQVSPILYKNIIPYEMRLQNALNKKCSLK